jgi:hypothetical protein
MFQCEWDKNAANILSLHWPDVPRWGDVSTLKAKDILEYGYPDVVAWGSPCQDLSVVGSRSGLSGSRSGLFYEGMRIIRELRRLMESIRKFLSGKMLPVHYRQTRGKISVSSSTKWLTQGRWKSSGPFWMHNTSECPSDGDVSFSPLSSILIPPRNVHPKYFLSEKAMKGIQQRTGSLPFTLHKASKTVSRKVSARR